MSWERMTAIGPAGENRWSRWRRLLVPSLFFAGVIYYEELFLKLFCFHAVTPVGGAVHPVVHPAHRDPAGTAVRRGSPHERGGCCCRQ